MLGFDTILGMIINFCSIVSGVSKQKRVFLSAVVGVLVPTLIFVLTVPFFATADDHDGTDGSLALPALANQDQSSGNSSDASFSDIVALSGPLPAGTITNATHTQGGTGAFTVPSGSTTTISTDAVVSGNITVSGNLIIINNGRVNGTITLNNGGTLHLDDEGIITGSAGRGVTINNGGVATMEGGSITGNSMAGTGGGLWMSGVDARFTMTGGSISDNTATSAGGAMHVTNGAQATISGTAEIKDNSSSNGGAINVYGVPGGIFRMDGGLIEGNTATQNGGALSFASSAVGILAGGTIYDNSATLNGGGMRIINNAAVTLSGTDVIDNEANSGGGIHLTNTTSLSISDGLIKDNFARATGGGGIHGGAGTTINITGGAITHNTAQNTGGGINLYASTAPARLSVSGDVEISNNRALTTGGGGIFAPDNSVVHILEGVRIAGNRAYTNTGAGGGVRIMGSATEFVLDGGEIVDNFSTSAGGGVHLGADSHFDLRSGTIADNRATGTGGGIHVGINAGVSMEGGEIRENRSDSTGGGIHLLSSSRLEMSGDAQIIENRSYDGGGGGVFATNATIIMRDASALDGNISRGTMPSGGGARVVGNSSFDISGESSISGNHSDQSGGGVSIGGSATFSLSGDVEVLANSAQRSGGIHGDADARIDIRDEVRIAGNSATTTGGGIGLDLNAELDFYDDVLVNNNTASGNGGGVHVSWESSFNMHGGLITNNTSHSNGGGVMLWRSAHFTMLGGSITNNGALRVGGGIGLPGTWSEAPVAVHIQQGSITGNSAGASGGGIGFTSIFTFADIDAALSSVRVDSVGTAIINNTAPRRDSEQLQTNHPQIAAELAGPVGGFNNMDIHTLPLFMLNVVHHFLPNADLSGSSIFEAGAPGANFQIFRSPDCPDGTWSFSHWEFWDEDDLVLQPLSLGAEFFDAPNNRYGRSFVGAMPASHIIAVARWNIAAPVLVESSLTDESFSVYEIVPPDGWVTEYRLLDEAGNEIPGRGWSSSRDFDELDFLTPYQVVARFVPVVPGPGPSVIGPSPPMTVVTEAPMMTPTGFSISNFIIAPVILLALALGTALVYRHARRRREELDALGWSTSSYTPHARKKSCS